MLTTSPLQPEKPPIIEQDDNDEDDDDELEKQLGLELLLGGLQLDHVSPDAWIHQDTHDDADVADATFAQETSTRTKDTVPIQAKTTQQQSRQATPRQVWNKDPLELDLMFSRAHVSLPDGRMSKPPVQVVKDANKGKALVATLCIGRGETIYTERAAVATQLPHSKVRACQHCFRSLEPASALKSVLSREDGTASLSTSLPLPHLWPVPELDFSQATNLSSHPTCRVDAGRRIHCTACNAYFCHEHCLRAHEDEVGNHCLCQQALHLLVNPSCCSRDKEGDDNEDEHSVQAPVALATRMFAQTIHSFRKRGNLQHCVWRGLCGSSEDLTQLELGSPVADPSVPTRYTLQPLYTRLAKLYSLDAVEQQTLSLELLETLCAMAGRNGFGIRTQSPFSSYYNALIRHAGGRGTNQHKTLQAQVAQALGSSTGVLERGMDRLVQEWVAPEIVAMFPLTARINHSCCPGNENNKTRNEENTDTAEMINAQVTSQVFIDCHMDLVATRDINPGDEILISYLGGLNRKPTAKRRRELRAKYLFDCACPKCQNE